jgi:hypothetical protein
VQIAAVLAVLALAARARSSEAAIALAALAPCVFLLTNRIFSPQFFVPLFASWAVAAALLSRNTREQLAVGVVAAAASLANAFVYPYALPHYTLTWQLCSALLFTLGIGLTGWLVVRASGR